MREEALIRRVNTIIDSYDQSRPFALYLKEYFRKNPQMGARDRRMSRSWCFNYLRLGKALNDLSFRERLAVACFLCSTTENEYLVHLFKETKFKIEDLGLELNEKVREVLNIYPAFNLKDLFPMSSHISDKISEEEFALSFLKKPRVWIRIRQTGLKQVHDELKKLEITYKPTDSPLVISFLPDVQLEKTESYQNGLFEIQDLSSQMTGTYFRPSDGEKWWDICAGSGGKSLLLLEMANDIHLLGSDVRETILASYAARMRKAGHHNFQTQVMDFDPAAKKRNFNLPPFDGVIADVPCTGSGTWARSPEWNRVDLMDKIRDYYVPVQRNVVSAAVEHLKAGRPLIYITCSVFSEENEKNIVYFEEALPLKLEKSEYFKGYSSGADTLFVARFIKK